jgi:hypothetical protein
MNLRWVSRIRGPLDKLWSFLASLLGSAYRWARTTCVKWVDTLPMDRIKRKLKEPARILAGTVTGMLYGPMTAAVLGIVIAVLPGVIKGYSDVAEAGAQLLLGTLIVAPIFALTIGLVALTIGGIVGAINTIIDGSIGFGLEWSLVAGLGAAAGIGIRYANLEIALLGLAGGGIVGGSVGFLTWLTCTGRHPQHIDATRGIGYGIGLVLIGALVPIVIG